MRRHLAFLISTLAVPVTAATAASASALPVSLASYRDPAGAGLWEVLRHRAETEPFNLVALGIFAAAIIHTFLTARIRQWAHAVEERHAASRRERPGAEGEVSFAGQALHFLGEVEAVFGIWVVALAGAIAWFKGWPEVVGYLDGKVSYVEPVFVVVVMTLAATRPVLDLAERCLRAFAGLGGGTPAAWWLSILILAPLLGSFITEPAAMTIGALLLSRQFYALNPGRRLAYATLGLLFVNVSVGGVLTHFAAPPVIMVAGPWGWDLKFMFTHFGLRAILGVVLATLGYFLIFRRELAALGSGVAHAENSEAVVPLWITAAQLTFLGFTVFVAHTPPLFIGGFLFDYFGDWIHADSGWGPRMVAFVLRRRAAEQALRPVWRRQHFRPWRSDRRFLHPRAC